MKLIDLTGKKFGRLFVINRAKDIKRLNGRKDVAWNCLCDCGNTNIVRGEHLRSRNTISCGCYNIENIGHRSIGNIFGIKNRKGTKNITGEYWCRIKHRAKSRNLEFSITIEYIQELLEKQNFKCALSGEDLIMSIENTVNLKGKYGLNTASLDRIDSSKGYTKENVQWIHKDINRLKSDFTQEFFIRWCKKIAKNNNRASDKLLIGLLP